MARHSSFDLFDFDRLGNTSPGFQAGNNSFGNAGFSGGNFDNDLSINTPTFGPGGSNALDPASSAGGNGFQWFGKNGALIPGLDALTGLLDAFTARKTLKAQKEAFSFNKGLATTNLANSAQITNAEITDQANAVGRQTGLSGTALDEYVSNRVRERRVAGVI